MLNWGKIVGAGGGARKPFGGKTGKSPKEAAEPEPPDPPRSVRPRGRQSAEVSRVKSRKFFLKMVAKHLAAEDLKDEVGEREPLWFRIEEQSFPLNLFQVIVLRRKKQLRSCSSFKEVAEIFRGEICPEVLKEVMSALENGEPKILRRAIIRAIRKNRANIRQVA